MNVRELIIETQLQVQRLAADRKDALSEGNILWRLNTAQNRLVKDAIELDPNNPNRFLINQLSNSLVQKLITPNCVLPAYRESAVRGFSYLPNDFGYLINDRSLILEDCKKEFTASVTDKTYSISVFKFEESSKPSTPYYTSFKLTFTTNGIDTTFPYTTVGLKSKTEKFELVDWLIKQMTISGQTLSGFNIYWEKFDKFYYPDSFIFVSAVGNPLISFSIDDTPVSKTPLSITNKLITPYTDGDEVPNRGYKGDMLYDAANYNYYTEPSPESPVTQLADGKIYFYSTRRFLVSQFTLDYIRKPRRISLYLNQTSELDSNIHEKICSLAAEAILGNVEAANYPLKVQENITRT